MPWMNINRGRNLVLFLKFQKTKQKTKSKRKAKHDNDSGMSSRIINMHTHRNGQLEIEMFNARVVIKVGIEAKMFSMKSKFSLTWLWWLWTVYGKLSTCYEQREQRFLIKIVCCVCTNNSNTRHSATDMRWGFFVVLPMNEKFVFFILKFFYSIKSEANRIIVSLIYRFIEILFVFVCMLQPVSDVHWPASV